MDAREQSRETSLFPRERPPLVFGERHVLARKLVSFKDSLTALGYEEIDPSRVVSSFWDADILLTSRAGNTTPGFPEMPDVSEDVVEAVSEAFMDGGMTGSLGFGTTIELEAARIAVLRESALSANLEWLSRRGTPIRTYCVIPVENPSAAGSVFEFEAAGLFSGQGETLRTLLGFIRYYLTDALSLTTIELSQGASSPLQPAISLAIAKPPRIDIGMAGTLRAEITEPLGIRTPVYAWTVCLTRVWKASS